MRATRSTALRTWIATLALGAAGCGDTLLDHSADPNLLGPVCAPEQLACGGTCLSCSPPANAHATCASGACGFECNDGFNQCGGSICVAESPTSCGPTCADCTGSAPANASPICTAAHACGFECSPGYLRSGTGCQRATAISAGFFHTCAVTADGKVKCWGANGDGQLGNGGNSDSDVPVDVPLPGAASAVAAGYEHTCAVVGDAREVYCWGNNAFGELGDGTTTARPTPVHVVGISQVVALAAGGGVQVGTSFAHTCAVGGGGAQCWGANGSGQLGNGTDNQTVPVPATVLPAGVVATGVACGERHTCVVANPANDRGAVYCWGANDSGQLGAGGIPGTPALASGASTVVTGQAHSCAVVGTTLECWGLNSSGQVDAGSAAQASFASPHPLDLGGLRPTIAAAGRAHTCAVNASGNPAAPECFGADNAGQLGGAGPLADVSLLAPFTATAVSAGGDHTCVLTGDGGIQCWGANDRGQLGNGQTGGSASAPAYVSGR